MLDVRGRRERVREHSKVFGLSPWVCGEIERLGERRMDFLGNCFFFCSYLCKLLLNEKNFNESSKDLTDHLIR